MENKLLEKNIDRVLSMVGNNGRTVTFTICRSSRNLLRSLTPSVCFQVTTSMSLKLALREEDCLKTPAESMMIDAAFSSENGRMSKAEERRQVLLYAAGARVRRD